MWFLQHSTNSGKTGWKRRSRRFWICMTHRGGELFSQRYGLSKLGDIDFKYSVILEYFVQFSSSPSRSTRTLWNEYQIKTTNISTQDKNFRPQKCSSAENLKNGQSHNFVLIFWHQQNNLSKTQFSFQYSSFEVLPSIFA